MATRYYTLFSWKIPPATEQELKTADAIVTQAFARLKDNTPGPGNAILAQVTRALYTKYHLPVLPQEEVAMADPFLTIHTKIIAESPDGRSTLKWNTYFVAKRQAEICQVQGWKRVIVVAVPFHMGRAVAVYHKVGLVPLPAKMPLPAAQYFHSDILDPTLRFRTRATVRELLCRLLFLYKGWI